VIPSKPMRYVLVMSVALAACAHPAPAPTAPAEPDAEARLAEANVVWFESKLAAMCACEDSSCFTAINGEVGAWMPAHFGEARVDEAQRQRLRDADLRLKACLAAKNEAAQALINMRAVETRMCACADAACVKRVSEEYEALSKAQEETKASESEIQEYAAVVGRITGCAARSDGSP